MIALMIALMSLLLLNTWKGDAELLAFYLPRHGADTYRRKETLPPSLVEPG